MMQTGNRVFGLREEKLPGRQFFEIPWKGYWITFSGAACDHNEWQTIQGRRCETQFNAAAIVGTGHLKIPPSFDNPALEAEFQARYYRTYRPVMLFGIGVGAVLFGLFGWLDRLLYPEQMKSLWWWRYVFSLPPVLIAGVMVALRRSPQGVQPFMALVATLVGWGTLGMIQTLPTTSYNIYYAGLMLIIFYAHSFVRLQFLWATLATLAILAGYEWLVWVARPDTPAREVISGHFFLVATTLGGMGASLAMEQDARQQFLLQRRLRRERRQLEAVNHELEALNRRLDEQAHRDELTGLANRRRFVEELERAWRDLKRQGQGTLSLIIMDIDHFKHYNDRFGHPAGDRCLQAVARVIGRFARRPRDLAARIGGEEFVILLPETPPRDAMTLATALRRAVRKKVKDPEGHPVTISLGVAAADAREALAPDKLLSRADQALYLSKRQGRDRVTLWRPELSKR